MRDLGISGTARASLYIYNTKEDIDEILTEHVQKGGRVKRLMLDPADKPPKKEA